MTFAPAGAMTPSAEFLLYNLQPFLVWENGIFQKKLQSLNRINLNPCPAE